MPGGVDAGDYVFTYDANGNVAQVLDLSAGSATTASSPFPKSTTPQRPPPATNNPTPTL